MIISDYSLKHRTTVMVLIVLIFLAGISAYISLPRESAPDIEFPYIMVMSNYEGTSPSDMESLITYPLERKLKNLSDVKKMVSNSSEGSSMIWLEFEPDVDIDTALQKVRDKVDEAKQDLPNDLDDPIVKEISANEEFPVMYVNITGDVGLVRLKKIAEDMEEDIEEIQGILDAAVLGGLEREIRVEFDQDRIAAYGLTMAEILATVTQNNLNTPGGNLDIGEARYAMKVPAEFDSPEEIFNLVISMKNGKPIYLSDIGRVRDTFKDRSSFSRVNGAEAVSIKVTKRGGEHILKIAGKIQEIISRYKESLPKEIKILPTFDSSEMVDIMVKDLENNIITGLILVVLVIFISLGFRNAILVSLAIPFSMLITFFILQALGITLNMVVLFSLILALGMLVDNAIVIVENIYRHHVTEGKTIVQAAMEGTAEVAWPVITSTATTVVAFFPLLFWPGIMGQFMGYLPKTVIIVLSASLFVALVITPVLSSIFIRGKKAANPGSSNSGEQKSGFLISTYKGLLEFSLQYRVLWILFFFSLLAIVLFAYFKSGLGVELFPDTEPNNIIVSIETPEGTNVYQTNRYSLQAERIINHYGNIENITVSVGSTKSKIILDIVDREFRTDKGDDGKIYIRDSNKLLESLRKDLNTAIVGAEVRVDKEKHGPPVGAPVNVEIAGNDFSTLALIAAKLKSEIQDLPGIVDLADDYNTGLPEVKIKVDKERAALLNLNAFLIGQTIKAAVNGIQIGDYREGEDEYDITARLPEGQRRYLQDILRLHVPAPSGAQVPLTSVAEISIGSGLSTITHINNKRIITVSSNVAKGFNSQQVLNQVMRIVKEGRFHLRRTDITDANVFMNRLMNEQGTEFDILRSAFSPETMKSYKEMGNPSGNSSEKILGMMIGDINRFFSNSREINRKKLSLLMGNSIKNPPDPLPLPSGYNVSYTGENEEMENSRAFMGKAFAAAVLLIALVLVTEFNSIITPFIILTSVILSFIGVFMGLITRNIPFGVIMTGMGVISLAGVVVNNAIVLIDYTNLLRDRGMSCHDAIIKACSVRMRPVLLTAVTTILGMLPMAIGVSYNFRELRWEIGSEMSQWWGTMATAVMFGLFIATALTLFVVPNLYSLLRAKRESIKNYRKL